MTRSFQPPERQLRAVAICRPESFVRGIGRAVLSASLKADRGEIRSLTQSVAARILPGNGSLPRQPVERGGPLYALRVASAFFQHWGTVAGTWNFLRPQSAGSSFLRAFVKHSPKSLGVRAVLFRPFLSLLPFIHAEQLSMESEAWRTQKQGI